MVNSQKRTKKWKFSWNHLKEWSIKKRYFHGIFVWRTSYLKLNVINFTQDLNRVNTSQCGNFTNFPPFFKFSVKLIFRSWSFATLPKWMFSSLLENFLKAITKHELNFRVQKSCQCLKRFQICGLSGNIGTHMKSQNWLFLSANIF